VLKHALQRGFSIVELAVTITIVAILMMLGMPSFSEYINNARLGAVAQSFYAGLSQARSEAIRLNVPVEFVMTSTPIAPGIENALAPDVAGKNWVIRSQTVTAGPYDSPAIDMKAAQEGGGATPRVTILATAAIVRFNGIGAATAGVGPIAIENPAAGACVLAGGPVRCWSIVVAPGGQVRLCDPAAPVGDTRSCTP
jgi:type IV fimbrial biogenesis protein FimT